MRDQQHIAPPFRADGQINGQFFFGFRARPQGVCALRLGGNFLSDQERLNPFASDILDALSKALTDSCPDAKKECCEITKKVSQYFDAERVSRACSPLVASLLANLKHQQWKVRRATLESIGALLLQEAPMMDHMEERGLAETLERWLLKGLNFRVPSSNSFDDDGPEGFDKFEPRLLILLLGVASDEEAEQAGPATKALRAPSVQDVIERRAKIPSRLQKLLLAGQILKNTENLQEVLAETPVGEITLIRTDKWIEEVEQDWRRLRKASDAVRNDRELVLAAINASEGQAIKYAGDEARSDAEIISAAMDFDSALCRYATGRLHTDRSFLLKALRAASTRGLGRKFHSYFRWNELQYVIGAARHHPEVRQLLNAHGLTAWPVARPPGRSGGRQRSPCGARKKQGPERPSLHFSNELREILEHVDTSKQTLDFWLQLVERDPLVLGLFPAFRLDAQFVAETALVMQEVLVAAAQICQGRRGWSSQVGEGARTLKKLERIDLPLGSFAPYQAWPRHQVGAVALGGLERVAVLKHEVLMKRAAKEREREERASILASYSADVLSEARRKAKEAREGNDGYMEQDGEAEERKKLKCQDPEVVAAFDYASVLPLLPEPFLAGRLPAPLTSTYVKMHLGNILPQVLGNITQWTTDIREAAARLLQVVLVIANRHIAPFLDAVLVHLYKASGPRGCDPSPRADDDQKVSIISRSCASMVGVFLDSEMVLEVVGKHLGLKHEGGQRKGTSFDELWPQDKHGRQTTRTVQDVLSGVKNFAATTAESRRQVFIVLARLLHPSGSFRRPLTASEVKLALRFLEEGVRSELLPAVLAATEALLNAGQDACIDEWPRVFDLLLRMKSGEERRTRTTVDANIEHLAQLLGRSQLQLYEQHLRSRCLGAPFPSFSLRSPNRHILETLLRNSGAAVAEHVGSLMPVLARQASPEDASASARVDLLGLVHFLVNEEDEGLAEAIRANSLALLDGVLLPNCSWRSGFRGQVVPGQSNGKIRRGGMVCVHSLLRRHLVPPAVLNEVFVDLMPILKSCLDDSWSPDNRMIACLVLSCTLGDLQDRGTRATGPQHRALRLGARRLGRFGVSRSSVSGVSVEPMSFLFGV
eukprot:g27525.t1